uniref:Putative lipocalin-8 9 n=1 Tax=Ixodes ricinus TaxID=34613 RepID=V5GXA1_IXORI
MFSFIATILFSVIATGIASTQTPNITACSSTHVVVIDDVTFTNAKVGETMIFSYKGQLTQSLNDSPSLKMTMTRINGGGKLPCIDDLGSCEYQLCGGTSDVEKEISKAWNGTCPIPAGSYDSSASFDIPYLAILVIGDGNINVKMEIINGGNVVECNYFVVKIEK